MPKDGSSFDPELDGAGLRLAIVVARFNAHITQRLLDGCRRELAARGVNLESVRTIEAPGSFELPLLAQEIARAGGVDVIICLGAVIRGETPHFDYVSSETANGIMRAGLDTGVPVVFGVLTTDTEDQALARAGGASGDKGADAALTAIEMARTLAKVRRAHGDNA